MRFPSIDKELFVFNRRRFAEQLKPGSLAIFHSNDQFPRNGDAVFKFVQSSDLFYLCGIAQEETILLLFPDCPIPEYREVLFLRKTSPTIAIWEGHKYTQEEAAAASGITTIKWVEEYHSVLHLLMARAEHVYLNSNENDRYVHSVPYRDLRMSAKLREQYPHHEYERSAPIMKKLRAIKSEWEVERIRQACKITEQAFRRVLEFVKPGVKEYEIEAEITHEFIRNGSAGHAYDPIIASGKNACVLHYIDNHDICKDGEVILFDFGAEYSQYNADLSRAIPVNGKYTKRQKDVYNAVLRVQRQAMKLLKPGNNWDDYHRAVGEFMEKELVDLKLLSAKDIRDQDPAWPAYKKYFMHGTSHHLGLDVHDLADRHQKFEPGMVFTCEPGIYILEEGLGVRIENDVVIRKDGLDDLMRDIPIEADEIEDLMNS